MKYITDIDVDAIGKNRGDEFQRRYDPSEKRDILEYLRSLRPYMLTTAPAEDPFTHEQVGETDFGYFDGEYTWYETEIYCFEKYDLALTDEFLAYIRKKLNIG